MGTFIRKMNLHPNAPSKIPPIAGPNAKPAAIATEYIPRDFLADV